MFVFKNRKPNSSEFENFLLQPWHKKLRHLQEGKNCTSASIAELVAAPTVKLQR